MPILTETPVEISRISADLAGLGERFLPESELGALLITNTKAREVFEKTTGLTLLEWAQQIREFAGILPETAAR